MLNRLKLLLVIVSAAGLGAGFLAPLLGMKVWQHTAWGVAAAIVLLFLAREIFTSLRRGEFGLDIVAALSMSGALYFGETLAAAVVSLMYSGGQLLEDFAQARARSEMNMLLGRVPKRALRYLDGQLAEVDIEELVPGDRILVRQGEIVPVDGKVIGGKALLDQSILTGESVPVYRNVGDEVLSGQILDFVFAGALVGFGSGTTRFIWGGNGDHLHRRYLCPTDSFVDCWRPAPPWQCRLSSAYRTARCGPMST